MRKTILFIFICLIPFISGAQYSGKVIYKDLPLSEALSDLEKKYNVIFSYTADLTEDILVNIDVEEKSIEQVLSKVLEQANIHYKLYDNNYIVLTRQSASEILLCANIVNDEGEQLPYVNVFLPKLEKGTISDESGNLNWLQELDGNEAVEISYLGYETYLTNTTYLQSCPTIELKAKLFSFEEVIVKEYVTSGIEQSTSLDHMIMRPGKINMVPGLTDADVLQMVQLLPGVESIDESATGLYVRGGTPDQNLILYDGIPVYNGGHFFGMISAFNPSLVNKVNVYRSGFGPNFGGRVSSVIDIKSINAIPERVKVDAGINFTHGDISLIIPMLNKKVGLVLGARKSYTDIIETPTYRKLSERVFRKGKFDELKEDENAEALDFGLAFDFNDYNAKLLIEPTVKDQLSISFFQIDDKLDFDFTEEDEGFKTNDKLDQNSTGLGVRWERNWNRSYKSTINFSQTKLTNSYTFSILSYDSLVPSIEDFQFNDIKDNTIVWENKLKLNKALDLDFGVQYADLSVNRKWQFDADALDIETEQDKNQIITGYFSLNSVFKNKLKSKLGLRWSQANATKINYIEPRLSLLYLPNNTIQLKASAGLYRQFMSQVIEFNDLGINQDFWVLSDDDENVSVSLSKNYSLGFIYHPKSFMFEVEGYYKQQEGLTSNLSSFQFETEDEFELGNGSSWGIDLLLKKRWNHFQSWISYSYSRTDYLVDVEEEILEFRAPHDKPHSFTFMSQYNHLNWNVSVSWKINSGILYTESTGLVENDDETNPSYTLEDINAKRLPISHRLDASVMYKFYKKKGFIGKLGFSLLNMYNRENLMSREYFSVFDEEDNQYELQERDRAMLRFTPNIVLRLGFE